MRFDIVSMVSCQKDDNMIKLLIRRLYVHQIAQYGLFFLFDIFLLWFSLPSIWD